MDTSERWRKFDREELTRQYSPSQWSKKKADEVVKIHTRTLKEGTELARSTVECELGIKLSDSNLHQMDVFGRKNAKAGTTALIYIHGGYWQALGLEYANFAAINITKSGGVLYSVGYSIAPHGTIEQMIDEVKAGICHVLRDAESRNFSGVYLCGHSAGAHLTSMMLTVDWEAEGVNSNLLKGAVLLSGVYDLRPLVNTYVNDLLKMTEESASQISPQLINDRIMKYSKDRFVFVVFGKYDSEEFIRQGQHFADTLRSGSCNVSMRIVSDCDHFNVVERLMDPDYEITQEILHLMGLTFPR